MRKFVKVLALALALSLLFAAAALADSRVRTLQDIKDSGTLVIGVFSDKKPFGYVDENGDYQGYDVYFARRLAQDLGVELKLVSVDAPNRVEYLTSAKVDIILANFTVTPARAEVVDFALPYMKVALGVVSLDSALITTAEQLAGKTLIVSKGTTAEPTLSRTIPKCGCLSLTPTPKPLLPCWTDVGMRCPLTTQRCLPGRWKTPALPWASNRWAAWIPSPRRCRRATIPFAPTSMKKSRLSRRRISSMLILTRPSRMCTPKLSLQTAWWLRAA